MNKRYLSSHSILTGLVVMSFLLSQKVSASIIENTIDTLGLSEPIALSYGDHTINSSINPGVDIDGYTFQGGSGNQIRIVVASHSNIFDPVIELRNPAGTVLQTQSCSGSFNCTTFLDQAISSTGSYFVNISDSGNNNAGNYTLHLEQYPPTNNWSGLSYDNAFTEQIGHAGDHDFLAFNGAANTGVRINVKSNSNIFDPRLQVWNPLGELIADDSCSGAFNCSFSTELDLTLSGVYKMGVFDLGFNNTGSYSLNVGCVFGSCPSDAPNPVPVPAAVWLFVSGLAGLRLLGCYKKRQN